MTKGNGNSRWHTLKINRKGNKMRKSTNMLAILFAFLPKATNYFCGQVF